MNTETGYGQPEMNHFTGRSEAASFTLVNLLQKSAPIVALLALEVDQISKLWVREGLVLGESIPQEGVLRITRVANHGMIFGVPAPSAVSLLLPLIVIALFVYLYRLYVFSDSRLLNVAVGLFIGGSLGNVVDRIAFGHVTDFVDLALRGGVVRTTFNIADVCIIIGIILFGIFFLRLRLTSVEKSG